MAAVRLVPWVPACVVVADGIWREREPAGVGGFCARADSLVVLPGQARASNQPQAGWLARSRIFGGVSCVHDTDLPHRILTQRSASDVGVFSPSPFEFSQAILANPSFH